MAAPPTAASRLLRVRMAPCPAPATATAPARHHLRPPARPPTLPAVPPQLQEVTWTTVARQDSQLHVTRFVNEGGQNALSIILHQPSEGGVAAWRRLRDAHGGRVRLEQAGEAGEGAAASG